jgi:hypothetical protein
MRHWAGLRRIVGCLVIIATVVIISSAAINHIKIINFFSQDYGIKTETLIVENGDCIDWKLMDEAVRLKKKYKIKKIIIAVHNINNIFNKNAYIDEGSHAIILATVNTHPITLNEARRVIKEIAKDYRSATLMTDGFHERRSYFVYKKIGDQYGIKIYPRIYFKNYNLNNWWMNREGMYEYFSEMYKMAYYAIRGYI